MFLRKLLVIVVPLVLCGLCVFFLPLLSGFGLWSDLLQGLILGALLALLLLLRKRRPSSMSSWLMSALTRCRSSRLLRS